MSSLKEVARRAQKSRNQGLGGQEERVEEEVQRLLGWQLFHLHPLRVPGIINMHCHSYFSSGDFIQSLQKLRIKCHGFVFWKAKLSPKQGSSEHC